MYLLGLRALGHEVFYIEDTGECVYDPVQNTRADRSVVRHVLHPRGARAVRARRSLGVRQLRRHLPRPQRRRRRGASAPTPTSSSTCPAAPGSGATSTRASRAARSSTPTRPSPSWPSPRPSPGTSSSSSASTTSSPSARTSARRPARSRSGDFIWHKTWQPVTLDAWQTERPPGDRFTTRHDLADRKLHRRRRQQGSGVRASSSTCRRAPRSRSSWPINGPQKLLREHGWSTVDAMGVSRTPVGLPRLHSSLEGGVRRREAHLRVDAGPAGSAIGRSATSRRGVRRSCRTPAGRAHLPSGRRAAGLLVARRSARRHRRASTATTPRHARARGEIAREHFDADRVLARLLDEVTA